MEKFEFTHYEAPIDNMLWPKNPYYSGCGTYKEYSEFLMVSNSLMFRCEGVKAGDVYPKEEVSGPIWQYQNNKGNWTTMTREEEPKNKELLDAGFYRQIYHIEHQSGKQNKIKTLKELRDFLNTCSEEQLSGGINVMGNPDEGLSPVIITSFDGLEEDHFVSDEGLIPVSTHDPEFNDPLDSYDIVKKSHSLFISGLILQ